LSGLDSLTHSLFWSLVANVGGYVAGSLWRAPSASEASQALLFVDVFSRTRAPGAAGPVFWRGQARLADLRTLADRFLGVPRATRLFRQYARSRDLPKEDAIVADAQLVQFVETELAASVGGASARLLVASVVQEQALALEDVLSIVAEASQLRAHSRELEEKSASLKRASEELRVVNEQLKSLDRLKDDFMSSVTHELRTPLTSIRSLSEMMVDDPEMDSAQRQQFLGIVVAETERLSRLVNQVLDLARIEAGEADWHYADIDPRDLAERAVKTTSAMFRERGATVELVSPAKLPSVRTDPDRVMQVMLNLLSNAAKFLPASGGRVAVRLRVDRQDLIVEVQDNGRGVPAGQEALIFEKFRQGGEGAVKPPGTGLGLPICRQIVGHLGGRMWLAPGSGDGACFGFSLPLCAAAAPAGEPRASPVCSADPAATGGTT
jgi:signal transduction histidine kinase